MKLLMKRLIFTSVAMVAALFLDQATKYIAADIQLSNPLSNDYYIITLFEKLYRSAGVHFFLINVRHYFELSQLVLRVVVLPLIGVYMVYYVMTRKITSMSAFIGFGLMIGALLGNAVDIVTRGYVIDWIGCSFFISSAELNYAINVADIIAVFSAPIILVSIRYAQRRSVVSEPAHIVSFQDESVA
ncbi:MAG: signal peptidase II [Candidatus Auribacterota bacterium]|jgi:lipoprotein signal peptidase|uniref:Uncharacterized protein n=1 Tax=Candidatus Auribacter fodinae TaxID=2093366 RepID=A0A3A4QR16_9BACT|nr:MAG: hypothetical protein C4541_12715 [Candidatus Auribacter fodinae]